jgi:hypothetical protein
MDGAALKMLRTLSPQKAEGVRRFTEELKAYSTAEIEAVIREQLAEDMAELRRKYPESFRKKPRRNRRA